MAGCAKADKKRKSAQNIAYKAMNKAEVNKAKRIAKHARLSEKHQAKILERKSHKVEIY